MSMLNLALILLLLIKADSLRSCSHSIAARSFRWLRRIRYRCGLGLRLACSSRLPKPCRAAAYSSFELTHSSCSYCLTFVVLAGSYILHDLLIVNRCQSRSLRCSLGYQWRWVHRVCGLASFGAGIWNHSRPPNPCKCSNGFDQSRCTDYSCCLLGKSSWLNLIHCSFTYYILIKKWLRRLIFQCLFSFGSFYRRLRLWKGPVCSKPNKISEELARAFVLALEKWMQLSKQRRKKVQGQLKSM